jgi:hypothetical protein
MFCQPPFHGIFLIARGRLASYIECHASEARVASWSSRNAPRAGHAGSAQQALSSERSRTFKQVRRAGEILMGRLSQMC